MNTTDFLDNGLQIEEAIDVATRLARAGIDGIELSGGTAWGLRILGDMDKTPFRTVKEEAYYRNASQQLKQQLKVPIILTGGIRSYDVSEQLVEEGVTDYIGLCRPLIREPYMISRWKSGDTGKSACVSDNACFRPLMEGKGISCVHVQ